MAEGGEKNMAMVLEELRSFTYKEVPKPVAGENNVVIRVHTTGICGSDVHYWAHGKCGPFVCCGPIVLGHESSGIVDSVGPGVKDLKVGDRVAMEPGVPCMACNLCLTGRYNLCPDITFFATPPYDGTLAQYIEHPARFCFKMPDHMSFEEGALLEPLSVAVHACQRSAITAGSRVLITGAGPIGLVCLLVSKALGATSIVLTDMMENRLEVAAKLGATATFKADDPELLAKIAAHGPITQTIECSGFESALTLAIRATTGGGTIASVGRSGKPSQDIPLFEAMDKEIDIIGSFRYRNTYPTALELVASGRVNVKPLVTHHFTHKQSQEAFETAEVGRGGAIKCCIHLIDGYEPTFP
eukprot:TRINITY_DN11623_c0_g1_i1.p1 TRINITY_DN11623_c0_g1~~TRINITY_DN11623_c0_g1_i1.p1  ORF type:complete len:366 (-),score=78.64 TRINITY_DN11623_c0_g1_i1:57-1127(-)